MSSASSLDFAHSLDGRLIGILGLTNDTEQKLYHLGISTLEQLAKLAVNSLGRREREVVEAIRIELAERLAPHTVWCFTTSGFAAHFIIRADNLFFFKASFIPDDQESWTCTYEWQVVLENTARYDDLELFHNPLTTAKTHMTSLDDVEDKGAGERASDLDPLMEEHHRQPAKLTIEADPDDDRDEASMGREQPIPPSNPLPALLETLLAPLNARERWILELRYGLHNGTPRTLELVGEALNCTRARIGQIEQKAFKKIRATTFGMQRIRQALVTLESALEQSNGALPIAVAAQKLGLVTEIIDPHNPINEVRVRFLLSFSPGIDIPKGVPLVALKLHGYAAMFDALPGLNSAIQRLLGKASRPLAAETIFVGLEADPRAQEVVAQVPRSVLLACLNALPQIAVDDQGCYFLLGRTFDSQTPAARRLTAKLVGQRTPKAIERFHTGNGKSPSLTNQVVSATQPAPTWNSYDAWNHAIATYITAGVQRGSTVYLSIDNEVIEQIQRRLQTHEDQPPEAFLEAVKQRVVLGRRIELKGIRGRNWHGEPNGIAFLAAMVLAASRMAEDEEEEIASSNYFTRFCEVLDIDHDGGRPLGMRFGAEAEEPLWRDWIVWLGEIGLLSSARPGEGATRYTSYPISQTLLRGTDRDRLRRLFQVSNWSESWDVDTLMYAVRREATYLTKHLRTLLSDQSQRVQAIAEAIYEVYENWGSGDTSSQPGGQARGYNLFAEVWRSEDPLSGVVEYYLYPRSPRRQQFDTVIVDIDGQQCSLITDRPGRYMPLRVINEQQLNQGARYPITQPDELEALILPRRTFWILSPDPNNPESGVYASWGTVPLGTPFIILCRRELISNLEKLRTERLIEWSGEPRANILFPEWVEVTDCMVISPTWDGVEIEHRDLHEALRPKERLSIGLSGGLRAPQGGWLVGLGPQMTIFGFPRDAELRVIRISNDQVIVEETKPTNQPFEVGWPSPGDYLVEAVAESRTSQCLVKIVDWDDLEAVPVRDLQWLQLDTVHLCGAQIRIADEGA
jgi:hypothetical protein